MGSSLKLAVVSATVLSSAIMLKLLTPLIMEITISDLPTIYTSLISWLKPPYLYVVINCIIITIVASSKLQSSISALPTHDPIKLVLPVDLPPVIHEPVHPGLITSIEPVFAQPPLFTDEDMKVATEEIKKNKINKNVISMSSWTPRKVDLIFPVEKQRPPASARFSHRKPSKPTGSEGGRALGVAKPKRQDTLEATWKTITEGRSVPLTRHLRKSDTWETHGHVSRNSEDSSSADHNDNHSDRMTKSDTFDVNRGGGSVRKPPPAPSKLSRAGGSGRLRKDPSLGQEELNRRVEAFIKKFNEDMRLQRQESLNQYMEMINRGAH